MDQGEGGDGEETAKMLRGYLHIFHITLEGSVCPRGIVIVFGRT